MHLSDLNDPQPRDTIRCDYLIVGSGAGGSVAARELARAGKQVVVAEEGPSFSADEFGGPVGALTRQLYRHGGLTPFLGRPSLGFAEASCVGGGTVINGGLLWRTPPWILEEWEDSHHLSGYQERDLLPHFQTIERLLQVRTVSDLDGNIDSVMLARSARSLGWKVVTARRALGDCRNTNRCPTGCPTGAKKSVTLNYLLDAQKHGAIIIPNVRISSLSHRNGRIREAIGIWKGARIRFLANRYFLAAGPIHTPYLLRHSELSAVAGRQLRFHINLKFVAMFSDVIHPSQGTIFTEQVQEFERLGLYMMASNWQPHYVAVTLNHQPIAEIEGVLADFDRSGLFAAQVRSRALGRILSFTGRPIVWQSLPREDIEAIRFACIKMGTLLFEAGATKIYLPLQGEPAVKTLAVLKEAVERMQPGRLDLVSMHAMSSCPMSGQPRAGMVDSDGKVLGLANLWICDASVLPDNTGESPQETIMAVSHEIVRRHLLSR
jgi:choline dehydrogenase-like flavoprotein